MIFGKVDRRCIWIHRASICRKGRKRRLWGRFKFVSIRLNRQIPQKYLSSDLSVFLGAANYDDLRRLISTFFYLPFSTYSAPFFIDVFSYYTTALNDFLRRRFSSFFDGIISIYSTKKYLRTLNGTTPQRTRKNISIFKKGVLKIRKAHHISPKAKYSGLHFCYCLKIPMSIAVFTRIFY